MRYRARVRIRRAETHYRCAHGERGRARQAQGRHLSVAEETAANIRGCHENGAAAGAVTAGPETIRRQPRCRSSASRVARTSQGQQVTEARPGPCRSLRSPLEHSQAAGGLRCRPDPHSQAQGAMDHSGSRPAWINPSLSKQGFHCIATFVTTILIARRGPTKRTGRTPWEGVVSSHSRDCIALAGVPFIVYAVNLSKANDGYWYVDQ